MESNTKKYLLYGGLALGGYILYRRYASSSSPEKVKAKPIAKSNPAPPTDGQYSPVGIPGLTPTSGYPTYIPPGPIYGPVGYPGPGYPAPYPTPYPTPGYPTPYPQPYPQPYPAPGYPGQNPALCQQVVGLTPAAAIARLRSYGLQAVVVSVNGRPTATSAPYNYNGASLYVYYGKVVNAVCGQQQNVPYPAY